MKIVYDNVLVKPDSQDITTKGGLYIPDTMDNKLKTGRVISAGDGKYEFGVFISLELSAGQKILYLKSNSTPITIDGESYDLLKMSNVVGIYDSDTAN